MSTKQKILKAIDCTIDDIGEDRLIDILLDAFKAKKARIAELENQIGAVARELHALEEARREEYRRMRSNPLFGASGEYYFLCRDRKFRVLVRGSDIQLFERSERPAGVDYASIQINHALFETVQP